MIRSAGILPIPFLLSACLAASPAREQVGQIEFASQTYLLEQDARGWLIRTPEGPVPCRAATERDCYWSLRAHLVVQDADGDMG